MTTPPQTPETETPAAIASLPAGFFAPVATVSPGFLDLNDPFCLHCGARGWGTRISPDEVQHDAAGESLTCPACGATYRPRGGTFRSQGESRPERWCGRCEAWRIVGHDYAHDAVRSCIVCGYDFDMRFAPPEQALLEAHRGALTAETAGAASDLPPAS